VRAASRCRVGAGACREREILSSLFQSLRCLTHTPDIRRTRYRTTGSNGPHSPRCCLQSSVCFWPVLLDRLFACGEVPCSQLSSDLTFGLLGEGLGQRCFLGGFPSVLNERLLGDRSFVHSQMKYLLSSLE